MGKIYEVIESMLCSFGHPVKIDFFHHGFIINNHESSESYLQYHKCRKVEDPRQRENQRQGVPEGLQDVDEQAREEPRHPRREGTDVDGPDEPAGNVGVAAGLRAADDGGGQACV